MSLHEIAAGYEFLVSTLSADSTLTDPNTGLAPGGVWRGMAPVNTPAPFVVVSFLSGADTLSGNAYRLLSRLLYQVKVVAPNTMTAQIAEAAALVDDLLKRTAGSLTGGYIDACYRESPFALDDPPVAGVIFTAIGGNYRLEIQQSS